MRRTCAGIAPIALRPSRRGAFSLATVGVQGSMGVGGRGGLCCAEGCECWVEGGLVEGIRATMGRGEG